MKPAHVIVCMIASAAAVTMFLAVLLNLKPPAPVAAPVVPPTVTLGGEVELEDRGKPLVIYYKTPFASPPQLTFPDGSIGYAISDQQAESFTVERVASGTGVKSKIRWRAEGALAK